MSASTERFGACTMADAEYQEYIERTVDAAPPLHPSQIAKLTSVLDYEPPQKKRRKRR